MEQTLEKKLSKLPDSTTLGEIRVFLRDNWEKGCACPGCQQRVQIYSRPITSSMAAGLIMLCKAQEINHDIRWIHIERFFKNRNNIASSIRGDISKLRYWNLIEAHPEEDGLYRVTHKGVDFVHGRTKVEANVLIYNNKIYGFRGAYRSIVECLKKKFDYNLLIKGEL